MKQREFEVGDKLYAHHSGKWYKVQIQDIRQYPMFKTVFTVRYADGTTGFKYETELSRNKPAGKRKNDRTARAGV